MIPAPPAFTFAAVEAGGETVPLVRRGPEGGPRLLILQPLFEELNRTRRLLALTGAALAALGVASFLPDLPGTGDHPAPQPDLARCRAAAAALGASLAPIHVLAVRGGALFAEAAAPLSAYLLAPADGASLWRDLVRARAAANTEAGSPQTAADLEAASASGQTLELAGYRVGAPLAAALKAARAPAPAPHIRTVTLGQQPAPGADAALTGPPVWRQAEPEDAVDFARRLAADIAAWIASCS